MYEGVLGVSVIENTSTEGVQEKSENVIYTSLKLETMQLETSDDVPVTNGTLTVGQPLLKRKSACPPPNGELLFTIKFDGTDTWALATLFIANAAKRIRSLINDFIKQLLVIIKFTIPFTERIIFSMKMMGNLFQCFEIEQGQFDNLLFDSANYYSSQGGQCAAMILEIYSFFSTNL